MVNPNIAPPAQLNIQERVVEIKKFLKEQEEKIITPKPISPKKSETQAPFEGTYKTPILGLKGTTSGQVAIPTTPINNETNKEMLNVLKKISENQEIDRKRWERRNPFEGDESTETWSEVTIAPGYKVDFELSVNEGHVFYLDYMNITFAEDVLYDLKIDGIFSNAVTDPLQDWGQHFSLWNPPKMCYNNIIVSALNLSDEDLTFGCFIKGFNRWYRSIKREITYESLKKSPDTKIAI